ncbi:hypothetical protein WR25_11090 [Diploscapter pachys]|uniref:Uncharacterized protein n=1 Tax=Diploscapter pachys TaxID=2018661 RepID=A0A2A2KBQ2_9BILA|nr:hypothetical protein WR25_11090 [Diploscapter pachys]
MQRVGGVAVHRCLVGLAADIGYQLGVGIGEADALAAIAGIDRGFGLQVDHRLCIAVVCRTGLGQRYGVVVTILGRTGDAHLEREVHLSATGVLDRVAAAIDHWHRQLQLVFLARDDRTAAKRVTFGVVHGVRLRRYGIVAKHQLDRGRILQPRLHVRALLGVVDIQLGRQRGLGGLPGPLVARTAGGVQRAGHGQTARVGQHGFHAGRRVAGTHLGIIGQTPHGILGGAGEDDLIVVGSELAAVLDVHIEVAGTGTVAQLGDAAPGNGRCTVDVAKEGRTELAILVDTLGQLAVDRIGDHQRHTAQFVERRVEGVPAVTQQATDFATGSAVGDVHLGRTAIEHQIHARRVGRGGFHTQRLGGVAQHQGLAVLQADVVVALALHHVHADKLVQLAHRAITLVKQVIGLAIDSTELGDLLVEVGDGLGDVVHLFGHRPQTAIDVGVLLGELRRQRIETLGK